MRIKNDSPASIRIGNVLIKPGDSADIGQPTGGVNSLIRAGALSVVGSAPAEPIKVAVMAPVEPSKQDIMAQLDDAGIEYDKRFGVKKLISLLEGE